MKKIIYTALFVCTLLHGETPAVFAASAGNMSAVGFSVRDEFDRVRQLMQSKRYEEAYSALTAMQNAHGKNREWMRLMVEVDDAIMAKTRKPSRLYDIDKLTYKVAVNPTDSASRYKLVDRLTEEGRFYEAEDLLKAQQYVNVNDPQYTSRVQSMAQRKASLTSQKVAQINAQLQSKPNDPALLRELAYYQHLGGNDQEAIANYTRAIQAAPRNEEIRYEYADLLMSIRKYPEALQEVESLLQQNPNSAKYKNLYASITLFSGKTTDRTEQYLQEAMRVEPNNIDVLANMALLRVYQGRVDEADQLARRAQTVSGNAYVARLEELDGVIAEAKKNPGNAGGRYDNILEEARRLFREKKYFDAADKYEEYFKYTGQVNKGVLMEMADAIFLGGDGTSAIGVLQRALEEAYDAQLALRVAQIRYDMNDFSGAIAVLEEMTDRGHKTVDGLLLLGDAYSKAKWFDKARMLYQEADTMSPNNEAIKMRLGWVKPSAGMGDASDYVALLIPSVQAVHAEGFETHYNRISMGVNTQVTLPIPVVLTGGFTSHGVDGTRFQRRPGLPGSDLKPTNPNASVPCNRRFNLFNSPASTSIPCAEEWFNQISLGAFVDLTKALPYHFHRSNYTNRISAEGGIYDYSGGRTAPFGAIRFSHQTPKKFYATVGASVDEGSIALWAPSGAENKLQLRQISGEIGTTPDQKLRAAIAGSYNTVKHNFAGDNTGINLRGDLGYQVGNHTALGLGYFTINYDHTVDLYFSPTKGSYQEAEFWGIYENEKTQKMYLRTKASVGTLLNTNFAFGRVEGDLIYKFAPNIGLGLQARISQAFRYRGKTNQTYNTYSIGMGGISFYWTL